MPAFKFLWAFGVPFFNEERQSAAAGTANADCRRPAKCMGLRDLGDDIDAVGRKPGKDTTTMINKWCTNHVFGAALFVTVCGGVSAAERVALPLPSKGLIDSQCGPVDDLQYIEAYDGTLGVTREYAATFEKTTIQIQWKSQSEIATDLPGYLLGNVASARWCTGTLISDREILTAGHCFDVQKTDWISPYKTVNGTNISAPPSVLATLMVVNFGYQYEGISSQLRTPQVFKIKKLVEHREGGAKLDYAIIEIEPDSSGKYPAYKPATVDLRAANKDELIAIIQHPQGEPKMVEAGHISSGGDAILEYNDLDTWGGSSGSGIRDVDGDIIGVHTNGGCETNANFGVSVQAIAKVSNVF